MKYFRLLVFLAVTGLGSWSGNSLASTINFGTGVDPAFATAYVAQGAGIFEKHGLDVKLSTGPSGSAMVTYLIRDQNQAAIAAEQAGIQSFNLDHDVVVAAQTATADNWWGLVARDTPDLPALKGKRIGISLGSGSEVFWQAIVKKFNLDPASYKIVNVDPPEMVAALERRDIDAFVAWEPWLTRATESIPNTKVLQNNVGIMLPRAVLYVNREWADKNPSDAKAFVLSLVEANEIINHDRERAARYVASFLKLSVAQTSAFMLKLTFDVRLDDKTVEHLKTIESQMKQSGKLSQPIIWQSYIYPVLLRSAAPQKVDLVK